MDSNDRGVSRRNFLKDGGASAFGGALGAGLAADANAATAVDTSRTVLPYPRQAVGAAAKMTKGTPVNFNYPDASSPCVAVKLGTAVPGGVGPERDIVAYSTLCTHMGCPVAYDSGTNTFKGQGSYRMQRQDMVALPFFTAANAAKPPTDVNVYTFDLGGPVAKDRTHFFGGYEHTERDLSGLSVITISPANQAALGLTDR